MRSPTLLRRSRSLLKTSTHNILPAARCPRRIPCKTLSTLRTPSHGLIHKRFASATPSPNSLPVPVDPDHHADIPEPPLEEPEKPKRRARANPAAKEVSDGGGGSTIQLPPGLDILWAPEYGPSEPDERRSSTLPPPGILEEALNNLHIMLHPKTQHRATYSSHAGPPLEPTLALYCPIEGGDYVIDETVRELARRTNAEVVILDSIHLAAGECGQFGKAANSIQLPRNPLHFPSATPSTSFHPSRQQWSEEDEGDSGAPPPQFQPSSMTLTLVGPSVMRNRALVSSTSRGDGTPNKVKTFFDEVVNSPSRKSSEANSGALSRPRLIYIRDFALLASSSSVWYPPLLSAVRQRRQGPMARPTSPIGNPMAIVFGITPLIAPTSTPTATPNGFVSMLRHRGQSPVMSLPSSKPGRSDWGEDEHSERARERRLRDRLRKWERGDPSLQDEMPGLSPGAEDGDEGNLPRPDVVIIGGPPSAGTSNVLPIPRPFISPPRSDSGGDKGVSGEHENHSKFFRTSVLVPSVRSPTHERACRVERRREINELTIRMAVASIGGTLETMENPVEIPEPIEQSEKIGEETFVPSPEEQAMWEDWGNRIEDWTNVKRIADRAVGSVVAARNTAVGKSARANLDPTVVQWPDVHRAWGTHRASRSVRKMWLKESSRRVFREQEDEDEQDEEDEEDEEDPDEVIERVKQDQELDAHEQRLLPCIVRSSSITTTFNQVHLPPHTIDSVRTIVFLPILHPEAFSQGVLKDHAMTGCLLFGPPGTGKTLIVRALAKEAGCRMLAISPSDVMDMYVGEGEKLVRAVFSLARRLSPCVIFLDEIDALFGARVSARETGGAFAHRGVITEFMQEMDGLKTSTEDNVVVIGATNRPFDLDDAVLRRLPRRLLVDLPSEKEREEILKILLRDETLDPELSLRDLAKRTETFSGSDLKHLCVSAALDAVKERVDVPWLSNLADPATPPPDDRPRQDGENAESGPRILALRHFNKALKEITPSSSESLGTLSDLRKWNEEFGEGRKHKRRRMWGRDRFGFTNEGQNTEDGRVSLAMRAIDSQQK